MGSDEAFWVQTLKLLFWSDSLEVAAAGRRRSRLLARVFCTAADCLLPEEPAGTGFILSGGGGHPCCFFPSEGKPLCFIVRTVLPPAGGSSVSSVSQHLCRPQGSTFRVRSVSVGEQWLQHQGAPCRSVLLRGAGLLQLQPLTSALSYRRIRSEAKKCRKVYGIEHRDQWCTACRWKKACQRFLD